MQSSFGATETPRDADGGRATGPKGGDGDPRRGGRASAGLAALSSRRWFWPVLLLAGYVAQVLFRLSLVRAQDYPVVSPDESDYLVMARLMAGLPTTEIPGNETIPSGYSLLISPAMRLSQDPVTAYHLIMGINALLSCLVLPLVFVVLRRLDVPRLLSYIFATAAVMLPPVVFYSQYAMADTVLPALILAWLIGLHGLLSDGSLRRRTAFGVLAAVAGGYTMSVHDRGGVIVALTGVVLLATLALNWAPRRATAVSLGVLAVMVVLKQVMSAWVVAQLDESHTSAVGNAVLKSITEPALLKRTVMRAIGHLWYFMTSTWGMATLAVLVCVICVFSSKVARAHRVVAFVMVALMCGIALAAAAGLPNDHRIDTIVYARYLSPLVPLFFAVAAAAFYHLRLRSFVYLSLASVAVTLLTTELLIQVAGARLYKSIFILWALPDASFLSSFLSDGWGSFHAMRTTAVALAVFAVIVLVRLAGTRRRALAVGALGLALAAFASYATVAITTNITETNTAWRIGDATGFTEKAGIEPGDKLVMDNGFRWETRMVMAYQILDGRVWTRQLLGKDAPPADANVAALALWNESAPATDSWPNAPKGWHVAKADPKSGFVIWRRDQ